jgi:hypothetical protein
LADVLTSAGLKVCELPGWQGRGRELDRVDAVLWHHTVTDRKIPDLTVANLLRLGRSDLPGPLSQLGLDRSGRFWIVADGRCNHNGYGTYGNQSLGIEAFHEGTPEHPWPGIQLDAWIRGTAALLRYLGLPVERVLGHKETDPARKSDPAGLPMDRMRQMVAFDLAPPRTLVEGDDLLMAVALNDHDARDAFVRTECDRYWGHPPTGDELRILIWQTATEGAAACIVSIEAHPNTKDLRTRRGW